MTPMRAIMAQLASVQYDARYGCGAKKTFATGAVRKKEFNTGGARK